MWQRVQKCFSIWTCLYNFALGEMAERSIAAVLKTVDCYRSGGSNPSLSAPKLHRYVRLFCFGAVNGLFSMSYAVCATKPTSWNKGEMRDSTLKMDSFFGVIKKYKNGNFVFNLESSRLSGSTGEISNQKWDDFVKIYRIATKLKL